MKTVELVHTVEIGSLLFDEQPPSSQCSCHTRREWLLGAYRAGVFSDSIAWLGNRSLDRLKYEVARSIVDHQQGRCRPLF